MTQPHTTPSLLATAEGSKLEGPVEVPLLEKLRKVPIDARYWEDTVFGTEHFPVGYYCHQAADEIERLSTALAKQREEALEECARMCEVASTPTKPVPICLALADAIRNLRSKGDE